MARDIATSKIALALSFKICPPVSYLCSANSIIPPFNILESPIKTKVASQMICILFQIMKFFDADRHWSWLWFHLVESEIKRRSRQNNNKKKSSLIKSKRIKLKKKEKVIIIKRFQLTIWSSKNLKKRRRQKNYNKTPVVRLIEWKIINKYNNKQIPADHLIKSKKYKE